MALVFQYGSNTSSIRLNSGDRLCGDAMDRGLVCTEDSFELDFDIWSTCNDCAAADIREGQGRPIWGVLYDVPDHLIRRETAGLRRSLDAIEGSHYGRRPIRVRWPNGSSVAGDVITYTVLSPEHGLRTSIEYAAHIIAGLREHGAHNEYLAYVKERVIANNPDLVAQVDSL